MTIEDFWNQAFLSALTRCPAEEAKEEANRALEICIEHWQERNQTWSGMPILWQQQQVGHVAKFRNEA